jgi:hypothetical protein
MSQVQIKFRDWTIQDLRDCLDATGYIDNSEEWEWTIDNDAFKYIGFYDNNHKFLVGLEVEGEFLASICYIGLGVNGLEADWGGCPVKEGTEEEILEYIENRCN